MHGATRWSDIGIFAGFSRRESAIQQRQFSPPVITVQDGTVVWTYPNLSPRRPIDRTSDFGVLKLSLLDRAYLLDLSVRHYYGRPSLWDGDALWGSLGPLSTTQQSVQGRGSLSHVWGDGSDSRTQLDFGVEFSALDFDRERPRELNIYNYSCADLTQYYCPIDAQYLETHTTYAPGRIKFSSLDYSGFAQLSWRGTRWSHRVGLRYDRDDWLGNGIVVPRWLSALDLTGNGHSVLQFGANRYYGKSFLTYRLQSLNRVGAVRQFRGSPDAPFQSMPLSSRYLPATGLHTPYDDELAVNWRQRVLGQFVTLGYLARFGRDQVMTDYLADTDQYRYTNAGRSRTRHRMEECGPQVAQRHLLA